VKNLSKVSEYQNEGIIDYIMSEIIRSNISFNYVATFMVSVEPLSDFESGETSRLFNKHLNLEVTGLKWKDNIIWNPMMVVTRSRHKGGSMSRPQYLFHCVLHKPATMKDKKFVNAVRSFWHSLEVESLDFCELNPFRDVPEIEEYLLLWLHEQGGACKVDIDSLHKY
jgi:hypothetical protein